MPLRLQMSFRLEDQGTGRRYDLPDRGLLTRMRWAWARNGVLRSRIFDINWYRDTYPEVDRQGWDPVTHYLAIGAVRGMKPHLLFEPDWYLPKRPETVKNPLLDFIFAGAALRLDPSPYFHTGYYLEAIGRPLSKGLTPLGDFASRAPGERIVPTPLFDRDWYLRSYPDVRQSGFDPFLHFVSSGDRDGRSPGPWFDASWYRTRNIDVPDLSCAPLRHYLAAGATCGRDPCGSFAMQWYLSNLGDAACDGSEALLRYTWRGRHSWHSTHPSLPPPGSPVGSWEDLPWLRRPAAHPESSRRALLIVSNAAEWDIYVDRGHIRYLVTQPALDILLLSWVSWAELRDLPDGIAILDLPDSSACPRATIASRVLRALKFRDAGALVVEIGVDPDAAPIVAELEFASAAFASDQVHDQDIAMPAIVGR